MTIFKVVHNKELVAVGIFISMLICLCIFVKGLIYKFGRGRKNEKN